MYKICSKCKETKLLEAFGNNKRRLDSLDYYCKPCRNNTNKYWQRDNPEKFRLSQRKLYNKEENTKRTAKWRKKNPQRQAEHVKRWREKNPKKYKMIGLNQSHKRRTKLKGNGSFDKNIDIEVIRAKDGDLCGICTKYVNTTEGSIDHIIPISKGGKHTWDNVQLAHLSCNIFKGAKITVD